MIGIILLSFLMPSTVYSFSCDFCGQSWECDDTWSKCGTNGLEGPGCSSQGRCSDSCCAGGGGGGGGGGCNQDDWGNWSQCSASCGGGTQTRSNACGHIETKRCNIQSCIPISTPTPVFTPTPTPDLRFSMQFIGIKIGVVPTSQPMLLTVQTRVDMDCYNSLSKNLLSAILILCPMSYNALPSLATPITGLYNSYSQNLGLLYSRIFQRKQSIFPF